MVTRAVMMTYDQKFDKAIQTLRHLSYFSQMIVRVPKGQRRAFEAATSDAVGPFPHHEVIEHGVQPTTSDGLVRYGALRHDQMNFLLRRLRPGDMGLLIDDDLKQAQAVNTEVYDQFNEQSELRKAVTLERYGRRFEHIGPTAQTQLREQYGLVQFARVLRPREIRQRIAAIGDLVREKDPRGYFTFAYAARSNNGLIKRRTPTRWVKWSGILGFFPESRNPFDPDVCGCEDWDAAGRILCEFGSLLLADPSTAFNMDIDRPKYQSGGRLYEDRIAACDKLVEKYRYQGLNVFQRCRTAVGQLPSVTCNPRVIRILQEAA